MERYEEALAYYDKALEIKPDERIVLNNKGIALDKLGRREEARACYNKAELISMNLDIDNRESGRPDKAWVALYS